MAVSFAAMRFVPGALRAQPPPGVLLLAVIGFALAMVSCAPIGAPEGDPAATPRLAGIVSLVEEVKAFGASLGIEPTDTLRRSSREQAPLSMLWLWLQRAGTLARGQPVDVRMAVGFNAHKDDVPLERVYRVEGYSVYYRQGNEFADERSAATAGFSEEGVLRQVKVILHEDLHGDRNFALPWEIEESIVTPLASLAAVEFFRRKNDQENLRRSVAAVAEERQLSRQLTELAREAERLFSLEPPESARDKVLSLMTAYPTYRRQFERQIEGQNPSTVLEAKLSHDLAYFGYFDAIAALAESAPELKTLIGDLKELGPTVATVEYHLHRLRVKYDANRG